MGTNVCGDGVQIVAGTDGNGGQTFVGTGGDGRQTFTRMGGDGGQTFAGTGGDGGQTFVGTGGDWDEFVFSCSCPLANELNVFFSVHSLSPEAAQYETCYVTAHKGACRCASFHPNGLSFCFD